MIPIRLRKDNVVDLGRDRSGVGWPVCLRCVQPVHGYALVDERKKPDNSWELDVMAECCHVKEPHKGGCKCGGNFSPKDIRILTVPAGMGQTKKQRGLWMRRELAKKAFFAPDSAT